MLEDIKNTVKQSAVYGLSRVAAKSISFVLLPLYTSIFNSQTIGNINLLESLWNYLLTICLLSFETAIIAFCSKEKDLYKVKKILFVFFSILVFNSIIFVILGYLTSNYISINILKDESLSRVTLYCFYIAAFESLLTIPLTMLRLKEKPGLYSTIATLSLLINLLFQLYFLVFLNYGFEYIFISKIIAPLLLIIVLVPFLIRNLSPHFSKILFKDILKFSVPLMLASLLAILLNTVDRFVQTGFLSKDDIAVYTVGYSIGSLTNFFIVSPFALAFNVISWKKLDDSNAERFFTKSATYLYLVMIMFSILISFFIPEAIRIFIRNPFLWNSVYIIRIILLSNCIAALYYVSIQSYYFKKRTDLIFWIFLICLTFKILANYLMIPLYGINGSAYLSVISYTLLICLSYLVSRNLYFIRFETGKILVLTALYILYSLIVMNVSFGNPASDVLFRLLLFLTFPFILYICRFYEPIELERIRGFFTKYSFLGQSKQ